MNAYKTELKILSPVNFRLLIGDSNNEKASFYLRNDKLLNFEDNFLQSKHRSIAFGFPGYIIFCFLYVIDMQLRSVKRVEPLCVAEIHLIDNLLMF